jgi:hypothetical protein
MLFVLSLSKEDMLRLRYLIMPHWQTEADNAPDHIALRCYYRF